MTQAIFVYKADPQRGRQWAGIFRREAPEIDGVVYFQGAPLEPGELAPVRIVSANDYDLVARRAASGGDHAGVDTPAIRP